MRSSIEMLKWMCRRLIRARTRASVSECETLCLKMQSANVRECVSPCAVNDELPCIWVESHPSPSSVTLGSCHYMFPFIYTVNGHLSWPNPLSLRRSRPQTIIGNRHWLGSLLTVWAIKCTFTCCSGSCSRDVLFSLWLSAFLQHFKMFPVQAVFSSSQTWEYSSRVGEARSSASARLLHLFKTQLSR